MNPPIDPQRDVDSSPPPPFLDPALPRSDVDAPTRRVSQWIDADLGDPWFAIPRSALGRTENAGESQWVLDAE